MRKILICAPYGTIIGGISRWTEHIVNYYASLDKKDVELSLMPTGRIAFINPDPSLIFRLKSGFVDFSKILKRYYKLLKSFSPEIVHITTSASISLLKDIVMLKLAKHHKAKGIIHFRFGRIPELSIKRNWEWKLLKKVINISDVAIVIDQSSYNTLVTNGFSNIKMLPNPLAPSVSKIINDHKEIERKDRNLLFVGHVVKSKGVFELVEACRTIKDIHLKIIGRQVPGIKEKLLEKAVLNAYNPWIEIVGEINHEDIIKEMLSSDIFVLPTYTEGFPNVILESMACSCSIVASAVGAIPEMLGEKSGILVEPKKVSMLNEAIILLLTDRNLARICGDNAKKRVEENYSMPKVWNQLIDIWAKI